MPCRTRNGYSLIDKSVDIRDGYSGELQIFVTNVDLLSSVRRVVCGAALYSPRSADLPVWGATVKVLYMTYCGKSESAAVPVGIALQQCRAAAVPVGIALR
jgi:hypothetical protein